MCKICKLKWTAWSDTTWTAKVPGFDDEPYSHFTYGFLPWYYDDKSYSVRINGREFARASSVNEAKQLAQADIERRISRMLKPKKEIS